MKKYAVAAVATLRSVEKIDAKRIYVLGHSLGGMLIPRIAKRDKDVAGFVIHRQHDGVTRADPALQTGSHEGLAEFSSDSRVDATWAGNCCSSDSAVVTSNCCTATARRSP